MWIALVLGGSFSCAEPEEPRGHPPGFEEEDSSCPDTDGDGFLDSWCGGDDCHDYEAASFPGSSPLDYWDCFPDRDGDGYGDAALDGTDCDDTDPFIHPYAGEHEEEAADCMEDRDEDGWGSDSPSSVTEAGTDCDDSDPDTHPGVEEVRGDGVDQDCDGEDGPWLVSVVGANARFCGLDLGGELHCWGNIFGETVFEPEGSWNEVAIWGDLLCGLDELGGVYEWSDSGLVASELAGPGHLAVDRNGNTICAVTSGGLLDCALGYTDDWLPTVEDGGAWSTVTVGDDHVCALAVDGTISCWGDDDSHGEASPPQGTWSSIAAGPDTGCALDAGGELACWGDNAGGLVEAPAGVFVDLSLGESHACALEAGGVLSRWGSGAPLDAELVDGIWVDAAAADSTTCAIDAQGKPHCFGDMTYWSVDPP